MNKLVAAIAFGLVLTACGGAENASRDGTDEEAADATPPASATDTGDVPWPFFGGSHRNERAGVGESSITAASAPDLGVAWEIHGVDGVTSTPTVVDGTVYIGDWAGSVRAMHVEDGSEVWTTELGIGVSSSPAAGADALFVADDAGALHRLDRRTGESVWSVQVDDHWSTRLWGSPVPVDDLVIQPVAGFEIFVGSDDYTFRGSVVGLDAETGEERWRVYTTAGDETSGSGVSVWSTPAVDTERGLAFVGTGNTYEEPTSPFADSIMAIDYSSGELAWSTQFTDPDVFNMAGAQGADGPDADVGAAPTLWSADGVDMVGAGDKPGVFHALDRETGEILWETELAPGGRLGGVIGAAAYRDGRVFVTSNVGDRVTVTTDVSTLFALDAASGEILWRTDLPQPAYGQTSVVNDLVLQGTAAPGMYGVAADTGEIVWEHEPPAQVGAGPSIVGDLVLWGYGFWALSAPEDPQGGLLAFTLGD